MTGPAIDLEQLRKAVADAMDFIAHFSWAWNGTGQHPNTIHTELQAVLALIDGQAHYGHGAGDAVGGPSGSDCSCRDTPQQEACANRGCGFCRATHATQPTKGEEV